MIDALAPVVERRRIHAVRREPQGLAARGTGFFISFRHDPHLYAFEPANSALDVLCELPGTAWGLASAADRVFAVCGSPPDDDRAIYSFDFEGRTLRDPIRCPDGTGSYIAHDGTSLFLSQWYEKKIFRGTLGGSPELLLTMPRGVCGIASVDGKLAVLNTDDEESTEYFLSIADPSRPHEPAVDVAKVPFHARSPLFTSGSFVTNHRERGEAVEFELPPRA